MVRSEKIARSLVREIIFSSVDTEEVLDNLSGGKADSMSIEDVAKAKGVTVDDLMPQVEKGLKVESEHVSDEEIAEEVVLDHLMENEQYYDYLDKMEKEMD